MTELERARQEMEEWFCSPTCRHCNEMRQLMSTLERLVREDERQKCAELAWQMQSKEGRSEIGNAITGRAEEKPAPPAPPAAPDLADYQEWWSRQTPNNFKHESAVAIAYAQSKLARAESELDALKAENQRLRKALVWFGNRSGQFKRYWQQLQQWKAENATHAEGALVRRDYSEYEEMAGTLQAAEAALGEKGSK